MQHQVKAEQGAKEKITVVKQYDAKGKPGQ